jgi:hypothetical protein
MERVKTLNNSQTISTKLQVIHNMKALFSSVLFFAAQAAI